MGTPGAGPVRVLGIDPGTAATGFGVIDVAGQRMTPVWFGCLTTSPRERPAARLARIDDSIRQVIERFSPTEAAVEELFSGVAPKAALAVGQARGVVLLACGRAGIDPSEYSPSSIKQAVAGYGRADKQQVQAMVRTILGLNDVPRPDHAADALAVAICHAWSMPLRAAQRAGLPTTGR